MFSHKDTYKNSNVPLLLSLLSGVGGVSHFYGFVWWGVCSGVPAAGGSGCFLPKVTTLRHLFSKDKQSKGGNYFFFIINH